MRQAFCHTICQDMSTKNSKKYETSTSGRYAKAKKYVRKHVMPDMPEAIPDNKVSCQEMRLMSAG